jgi:hypothetical protein
MHWVKCFSTGYVNTGFFFLRAGSTARLLLKKAEDLLEAGKSADGADQGAISLALKTVQPNPKYIILLCNLFPSGNVFYMWRELAPNPIIVHANWMFSSAVKKSCLVESGLWLTGGSNPSSARCAVVPTPYTRLPDVHFSSKSYRRLTYVRDGFAEFVIFCIYAKYYSCP